MSILISPIKYTGCPKKNDTICDPNDTKWCHFFGHPVLFYSCIVLELHG